MKIIILIAAFVITGLIAVLINVYKYETSAEDLVTKIDNLKVKNKDLQAANNQLIKENSGLREPNDYVTESKPPVKLSLTCLGSTTEDRYDNFLTNNSNVSVGTIKQFFAEPKIQESLNKGLKFYQICTQVRGELSYVLYNETADTRNYVMGIYSLGGIEAEVSRSIEKSAFGGGCSIIGYLERNILFSCGREIDQSGFNTVEVLNRDNVESTVIKDCTFTKDTKNCFVNTLNLPEYPF